MAQTILEQQANKGAANGYPSLDGTGKIPAGQIPANIAVTTVAHGVNAFSVASGAYNIDASLGDIQIVTLTGNVGAATITNPTVGQELLIEWKQDPTGGWTYTLPANVALLGPAWIPSTAANGRDVLIVRWNGTNWVEVTRGQNTAPVPLVAIGPSSLASSPPVYGMYQPRFYEAAYRGTNYRRNLGNANGAVISLRFDDCPAVDYTVAWPALVDRRLPAGFAAVSSFLGLTGRLTASQLVAMENSGMEVLCHTAHHDTNPTLTDAYFRQETDLAVTSIRAQVQAVTNPAGFNQDSIVENFIQPGTWNTEPAACLSPQDLENIYWLWIQNHFAAAEGYIRDPMLRKVSSSDLDGVKMLPTLYKYGTTHATVCPLTPPTGYASVLAYAKALVDQCVKYGGYLALVIHTSSLDAGGGALSTADMSTLLDYIKTYRDNDQVDVLCPTAALYATAADEPYNMLADPSFNDSAGTLNPSWVASGSPVVQTGAGYTGGNAVDVDSSNYITQPKVQVGQLTEPACRTLHLTGRYKNAVAGNNQQPRFILRFYDGSTNNWVSGDTSVLSVKPAANDAWQRFDVIARAPRFPAGSGNAPIYFIIFVMGTTAGNKVRVSDLVLKKV